ncbi:MAG: gliding motility-associated C-terminal domain-containing protein, partial [Bacteroidota bacterium]|nr:gliding motility-associated C-terminal domain-containing protein [Bacteroidota bacterium]
LWQPGTGLSDSIGATVLASPVLTSSYIVKGVGVNGCAGYDTVLVKVSHTGDLDVKLPNAFSPNGDGKNECFGLSRYAGLLQQVDLSVYNRFGQRVFHSKEPSACWDGRFNGKLQPTGGYAYILKANTFCGQIFRKGIVMLLY